MCMYHIRSADSAAYSYERGVYLTIRAMAGFGNAEGYFSPASHNLRGLCSGPGAMRPSAFLVDMIVTDWSSGTKIRFGRQRLLRT